MLFCWTKGKMTVLGKNRGVQQNENFYRAENEVNNFGSHAGLHHRRTTNSAEYAQRASVHTAR